MKTFHLTFVKSDLNTDGHWSLGSEGKEEGIDFAIGVPKEQAITQSGAYCRNLATDEDPIEFKVHNKDGEFSKRVSATFPRSADPRKSKG